MKVAFVCVNAKATGGAEESLALLILNLPSQFTPVLVSFEDGDFAQRLRDAGIEVRIHEIAPAIRATRRDNSWISGALRAPDQILRLAATLREIAPDVVHSDTLKGHVLATLAARLLGIPTILHVRDMFEGKARRLLRLLAMKLATDYVAISKVVATWYGMPERMVIYNPVDLASYESLESKGRAREILGLPHDVPVVGIVGRINRWKGHDRFLRIVAKVRARRPIHAVVVGEARFRDYDFPAELRRTVAELGLEDCVTFVPWLADPRIAYAAIDVHANCSANEPFGRSIVEAAACGVPSVCFNDGALGELLDPGDLGFTVAKGDETAFADALVQLFDALPVRGPIIRRLERFSIATHIEAMTARLQRLAQKRH